MMLAQRTLGLLPEMSFEEALKAATCRPPFTAPMLARSS